MMNLLTNFFKTSSSNFKTRNITKEILRKDNIKFEAIFFKVSGNVLTKNLFRYV